MTIQVIRYHTLQPGPTLLLLGAVHGNETCGAHAIKHLNALLDNARVHLTAGTLITVPIANPKAYATHQRFCERNLNRQLYPKATCTYYEDHLTPILCPLLAEADCVLDLHSYTSQGGPFIFLGGNNSQETTYARALGVNHFIYGWQDAYNKAVGNTNETYQAHLESMGITEYARAKGALAITLECGHHHNTNATAIGLSAALNALQHFDMLRVDNPETILLGDPKLAAL
ncbi:MAG: succinylglutamate desuccinylase/aspartoacylase family protein [Gammaproteobacteria bacterium]